MSGGQAPPPGAQETTPFEIRLNLEAAEVWVRVTRCADVADAWRWVEAEGGDQVAWETLLRGSFQP